MGTQQSESSTLSWERSGRASCGGFRFLRHDGVGCRSCTESSVPYATIHENVRARPVSQANEPFCPGSWLAFHRGDDPGGIDRRVTGRKDPKGEVTDACAYVNDASGWRRIASNHKIVGKRAKVPWR